MSLSRRQAVRFRPYTAHVQCHHCLGWGVVHGALSDSHAKVRLSDEAGWGWMASNGKVLCTACKERRFHPFRVVTELP